jgi:Cys-tRNA(Pro)/Cys-tRNA(Cys) deacylase
MIKNNVLRLLEAKGVAYEVFETPEEKLSAVETAAFLSIPADQIYKTLVVFYGEAHKPLLAMVPGNSHAELKAVAAFMGAKKAYFPAQKEAEALTGLKAGGISPLALLSRGFPVLLDRSAERFERIYLSGGQRGLILRMSPVELATITGARLADIARAED